MPYYGALQNQFMPVSSLVGGLTAGQQFSRGALQDQYAREQMEDYRNQKAALKDYGQTKDINAVWQKSPETAMQIEKYVSSLDAQKQTRLMNDIKIFDAQKGMFVDNPEAYAATYQQIDPAFAKGLPKPEQFAQMNPQQRKGMLYQTEMIAAELKGQLTQAQAIRLQQQEKKLGLDTLKTQSILTLHDAQTALARAKITETNEGKDSKNLPQEFNLFKKIKGRAPESDEEYFDWINTINDAKGKGDPSKAITQMATKLLERDPNYQNAAKKMVKDEKTGQMREPTPEEVQKTQKDMRVKLQGEIKDELQNLKPKRDTAPGKGGGKVAAKPLNQMTDDEIKRLIAEKQAAEGQ